MKKINIHSFLKIGQYHTKHCEDELFIGQIGQQYSVIAVMDGCSSGIESHFAASLIKKILHKIITEEDYKIFFQKQTSASQLQYQILSRLFHELSLLKNQLLLKKEELLSTLILVIVDLETFHGNGIVIGDGLIVVNENIHEFDQDNQPDYIGYHLEKSFEEWFKDQSQLLHFSDIEDLSIATDGIFSFQKWTNNDKVCHLNLIDYFLKESISVDEKEVFHRKILHLQEEYGMFNMDDLAMIRLTLNE